MIKSTALLLTLLFASFSFADRLHGPMTPRQTYQMVSSELKELAKAHSKNVELITIGVSDQEIPLYALAIGNGPVENLLVATHHGNEYGSTEVALEFARRLSANPIPDQRIYVIPVLNTQGYDQRSRRERSRSGVSVDPNRDYPGPCKTDSAFQLRSTKALAQFIERKNIISVATLHTYAEAVLYPWGLSTDQVDTRYTDRFIQMGKDAAQFSNYEVANSTLALYPADGTFEDYVFWNHGIWSLLFEMGTTHSPSPEQVQKIMDENVPGLRQFFERAPRERAPAHLFEGACHKFRGLIDLKNE